MAGDSQAHHLLHLRDAILQEEWASPSPSVPSASISLDLCVPVLLSGLSSTLPIIYFCAQTIPGWPTGLPSSWLRVLLTHVHQQDIPDLELFLQGILLPSSAERYLQTKIWVLVCSLFRGAAATRPSRQSQQTHILTHTNISLPPHTANTHTQTHLTYTHSSHTQAYLRHTFTLTNIVHTDACKHTLRTRSSLTHRPRKHTHTQVFLYLSLCIYFQNLTSSS